jgi:hypothetical protein
VADGRPQSTQIATSSWVGTVLQDDCAPLSAQGAAARRHATEHGYVVLKGQSEHRRPLCTQLPVRPEFGRGEDLDG